MNSHQKKVLMILGVASLFLVWRMYVLITEYGLPAQSQGEVTEADAVTGIQSIDKVVGVAPPPDPLDDLWKAQQRRERQVAWNDRLPFDDVPGMELTPAPVAEAKQNDPAPEEQPQAPALVLRGVAVIDGEYVAIVSDNRLRVGDTIGDEPKFTVTRITQSSLILASGPWRVRYDIGQSTPPNVAKVLERP